MARFLEGVSRRPLTVRSSSKSRRGGGKSGKSSQMDVPSELPSEARAGGQPPGQPTDAPRARTWRRRPRRRRLSEEVCPLIAEPGPPSQAPPGASAERRRELSARPGVHRPHRGHGRLGLQPAGRGQVQLHPRYVRGGLPGSTAPAGGPHSCAHPAPEGAWRAGARRAPHPPAAARYLRARGPPGPGRVARPAASRRRRSRTPELGRGRSWDPDGDRSGGGWSARPRCSGKGGGADAGGRCRPRGGGRDLISTSQPALGSVQARIQKTPRSPFSSELFLSLPQKTGAGISLVCGDFPGDSRPLTQNFPPGNVGLVLQNEVSATASLELSDHLWDDFIRSRKDRVIPLPGCRVPFPLRRGLGEGKEEHGLVL